VELPDVQRMPARDLAKTLNDLGLEEGIGWAIGDAVHRAASAAPDDPPLGEPTVRAAKAGFQNQIVGRLTEVVFRDDHLEKLVDDGFEIADYHTKGDNRDYGVKRDGAELPINVKVASTLFRNAKTVVGLEPEDCIPISAYKALNASQAVPDLVYVDLVDFNLRQRVDDFMDQVDETLATGWQLLSWYGGKGGRRAEDRYVETLFARRGDELKGLAPGVTGFRVISAQRVLTILRRMPRRVPGLGVPGAGTGGFVAEVNVHVSVEQETRPWDDVAETLRAQGIAPLLDEIRRTATEEMADPLL
jgi:hypothetical protein